MCASYNGRTVIRPFNGYDMCASCDRRTVTSMFKGSLGKIFFNSTLMNMERLGSLFLMKSSDSVQACITHSFVQIKYK